MTFTLDISPDKEATFKAQAQALGLTVEQWLLRLADQEAGSNNGCRGGTAPHFGGHARNLG